MEASLIEAGLVPVLDAARMLNLEPKRLIGFMARNRVGDPIGDGVSVYGWSCRELAQRLSSTSELVTP